MSKKFKIPYSFKLSTKLVLIAIVLFYAHLMLGLYSMIINPSDSITGLIKLVVSSACYAGILIIFKKNISVLLLPLAYNSIRDIIGLFSYFNIIDLISLIISIAFIAIFAIALFKKIPSIVLKITAISFISINLISIIYYLILAKFETAVLINALSNLMFYASIFIIFFFAKNEPTTEALINGDKAVGVGILGVICLVIFILISGYTNRDETTSYYIDHNGNGQEDLGEGVWYEDKDGVHFYD